MVTFFQIVLILAIISVIGLTLGYIFGKISCGRDETSYYFSKGKICEEEFVKKFEDDIEEINEIEIVEDGLKELKSEEDKKKLNKKESLIESSSKLTKPLALKGVENRVVDDLKKIKGIGKVIEKKLNGLGVYYFWQIANWGSEEIAWVDSHLSFSGRIIREDWVGQAKILAKGEETEFSKRVARGEVATSRSD